MNINKFRISTIIFGEKNAKYASSPKRAAAAAIDVWIVLFLRVILAQIVALLYINQRMFEFITEFKNEFGTDTPKNTPEHINFIIHHPFFYEMLVFYAFIIMIGTVYHAYLNSSAWQGTVGKRLLKIMMVTKTEQPLTFNRGLLHYFLSIMPFVFLFYLLTYQLRYELNLFQAITASDFNIILSVVFVLWVQIHIFTKNKVTIYDMIANTLVINGRTSAKWPWNK